MPVGPGARYSVCEFAWGADGWDRGAAGRGACGAERSLLGWAGAVAWVTRRCTHERRALLCTLLWAARGGGCSVRGGAVSTLYSIAALWAGDFTVVVRKD